MILQDIKKLGNIREILDRTLSSEANGAQYQGNVSLTQYGLLLSIREERRCILEPLASLDSNNESMTRHIIASTPSASVPLISARER